MTIKNYGEPWRIGQHPTDPTKRHGFERLIFTSIRDERHPDLTLQAAEASLVYTPLNIEPVDWAKSIAGRIVACVNACVGISNERLASEAKTMPNNIRRIAELEKRLELAEACLNTGSLEDSGYGSGGMFTVDETLWKKWKEMQSQCQA